MEAPITPLAVSMSPSVPKYSKKRLFLTQEEINLLELNVTNARKENDRKKHPQYNLNKVDSIEPNFNM